MLRLATVVWLVFGLAWHSAVGAGSYKSVDPHAAKRATCSERAEIAYWIVMYRDAGLTWYELEQRFVASAKESGMDEHDIGLNLEFLKAVFSAETSPEGVRDRVEKNCLVSLGVKEKKFY